MLAIRMQRTGRKGHAMFRVVVQDSRRTPSSGKVVARLGSYDPHAKTTTLDTEKASFYLEHGAQPSDRVVVLLKKEGVKLPAWVQDPAKKERAVRNVDKRRSTRPAEPDSEEPVAEESTTTTEANEEVKETQEEKSSAPTGESTSDESTAADNEEELAEAPADTEAVEAEPSETEGSPVTDESESNEAEAAAEADNSEDTDEEK